MSQRLQEDVKQEFQKVFSKYGTPGNFLLHNTVDAAGIEELRAIFEFCITSQKRAYGYKGPIHFDFLENPSFNALATSSNGHDLIALFSGTIEHLYELFFFYVRFKSPVRVL